MRTSRDWLAVIALLGAVTAAYADGPGGYRPKESGVVPVSEQGAIDAYTAGYASILRAEHAENLAAASSSDAERQAALRDAQKAYQASLPDFATATRLDASMHEAYTYLGYANRKLGRYDESLRAYEQALKINPNAVYAIEYQGEAFLGLNRVDEARFNFLRLYALDQHQAAKLLHAIRGWMKANSTKPPTGIDMPALATWIAEKSAAVPAVVPGENLW
ncbi:MAG TPA: tetratricopeptide repeat protein [Steroidobacteraceae bacterium]|nr:tetratricopeptide repeat protein [Steroidobacteraceae bacterium]